MTVLLAHAQPLLMPHCRSTLERRIGAQGSPAQAPLVMVTECWIDIGDVLHYSVFSSVAIDASSFNWHLQFASTFTSAMGLTLDRTGLPQASVHASSDPNLRRVQARARRTGDRTTSRRGSLWLFQICNRAVPDDTIPSSFVASKSDSQRLNRMGKDRSSQARGSQGIRLRAVSDKAFRECARPTSQLRHFFMMHWGCKRVQRAIAVAR